MKALILVVFLASAGLATAVADDCVGGNCRSATRETLEDCFGANCRSSASQPVQGCPHNSRMREVFGNGCQGSNCRI